MIHLTHQLSAILENYSPNNDPMHKMSREDTAVLFLINQQEKANASFLQCYQNL